MDSEVGVTETPRATGRSPDRGETFSQAAPSDVTASAVNEVPDVPGTVTACAAGKVPFEYRKLRLDGLKVEVPPPAPAGTVRVTGTESWLPPALMVIEAG